MNPASIGRIVHVLVDPAHNNGSDVAPALVVRTWGEPHEGNDGLDRRQTVNVRVLGDTAETLWLTSIELFDRRPAAAALAAAKPHNPQGHRTIAFWPPRV